MIGFALERLCADWLIPEKCYVIGLALGLGSGLCLPNQLDQGAREGLPNRSGRVGREVGKYEKFCFQNKEIEMQEFKNNYSQRPGSYVRKVRFFPPLRSLEAIKIHITHSDLFQSVLCVFQTHLFVFGKWI